MEEGGGGHHRQSAQHGAQPPDAGMESTRAHRITRLDPRNGRVKITGKAGMRAGGHRGHLHLHLLRTVVLLVALTIQPQVSHRLSAISGALNTPEQTFSCVFVCISSHKHSTVESTYCPFPPLCCPHSGSALHGAVPTCCFRPLLSLIHSKGTTVIPF